MDLWGDWTPAWGRNGTYSAHLYASAAVKIVQNFSLAIKAGGSADSSTVPKGLFLYLPWHNTHTPLEAPEEYFAPPHPGYTDFQPRITYNAMARALDEGMGNVTDAIRAAGLWDATLLVFSADNGGWLLPKGAAGSSNFPLRGGKVTDFEGGVRSCELPPMFGWLNQHCADTVHHAGCAPDASAYHASQHCRGNWAHPTAPGFRFPCHSGVRVGRLPACWTPWLEPLGLHLGRRLVIN